jgi:hypothetical protein
MKYKPRNDSLSAPFDGIVPRHALAPGFNAMENGFSHPKRPFGKSDPYRYSDFGLLTTVSHVSDVDGESDPPPASSIAVKTGRMVEYEDLEQSSTNPKRPISKMVARSPIVGGGDRSSFHQSFTSADLLSEAPKKVVTSQETSGGEVPGWEQVNVMPGTGAGVEEHDEMTEWPISSTVHEPGESTLESPSS